MGSAEKCPEQESIGDKGQEVSTALFGAAWGLRSAERRKVNFLEMKCL